MYAAARRFCVEEARLFEGSAAAGCIKQTADALLDLRRRGRGLAGPTF